LISIALSSSSIVIRNVMPLLMQVVCQTSHDSGIVLYLFKNEWVIGRDIKMRQK